MNVGGVGVVSLELVYNFRIGIMSLSTNSCFAEHVPDDLSNISDQRSHGPFDDMGRVFYSLTVNSYSVASRVHFVCLTRRGLHSMIFC